MTYNPFAANPDRGEPEEPQEPREIPDVQRQPLMPYQGSMVIPHPAAKVPTGSECANCGQPIYYGQPVMMATLGIIAPTSNGPVIVPWLKWKDGALLHADCTAEFSHDEVTGDPCGQYEMEEGVCVHCDAKLSGAL